MKNQILQILIVIAVTAGVTFFLTKESIKPEKGKDILRTDTVYTKADTVYKDRPIAAKLKAKIDTTYADSAKQTIADIVAHADTLIEKDGSYIKVAYHYPPANYFQIEADIKEKIITITRDVMNYVKVPAPWWDHFIVGAGSVLAVLVGILLLIK